MLNHGIRGLLFHYKKIAILQLASFFFGKRIQKHPGSVCENDVNNEQNVRGYYTMYVKPSNERLIFLPEKNCYFAFYFLVRVSKTS